MPQKKLVVVALCGVLSTLASGCDVFSTMDSENVSGRGPQAFDPYVGADSGAIKLALQFYRGCSILATGEPITKGDANIPYPSECLNFRDRTDTPRAPTGKMRLITGTSYFLGRMTFMDLIENAHKTFSDPLAPSKWFGTGSYFRDLDWTGLAVVRDEMQKKPNDDSGAWFREVTYGNSAWQLNRNFSFLVEVLDSDGTVRAVAVFDRDDFLAENPETGHTRLVWRVENIGPPKFPGDTEARPTPGVGPPPAYRTMARIDFAQSTIPTKTITIDEQLAGDGAIRVTWSQMQDRPFYFPVTFVAAATLAQTCFDGEDGTSPVPCGFGLNPRVFQTTPKNGKGYYEPGETFDIRMQMLDGEGNVLHSKEHMPSYADYLQNDSNGLQYLNFAYSIRFMERDGITGSKVAGPIHKFRGVHGEKVPWFENFVGEPSSAESFAALDILPGITDAPVSTRSRITLPEDAEPGTYVVMVKGARQFYGERISKSNTFFFQVGQPEPTTYPNRVGNCQICHRGVLSLDNLHHGIPVDHVESCKTCHSGRLIQKFHRIHMNSDKFPLKKNDCTVCHLTRESAVRPSIEACSSCHPDVHGNEYFAMRYGEMDEPNRFSNCAQACHAETTPAAHILPGE